MAKAPVQETLNEETVEVDVNEATHNQLLWYSRTVLNLDVDTAETHNQTLARLKGAYDHPTIRIPRDLEDSVKAPVVTAESEPSDPTTAEDRYGLPEFVEVQVHGDDEDTGEDIVKLAHNGKTYILQVGKTVRLPWYVFKGCIDDAKEIRYSSGRDTGLGPARTAQGISFTRVR